MGEDCASNQAASSAVTVVQPSVDRRFVGRSCLALEVSGNARATFTLVACNSRSQLKRRLPLGLVADTTLTQRRFVADLFVRRGHAENCYRCKSHLCTLQLQADDSPSPEVPKLVMTAADVRFPATVALDVTLQQIAHPEGCGPLELRRFRTSQRNRPSEQPRECRIDL